MGLSDPMPPFMYGNWFSIIIAPSIISFVFQLENVLIKRIYTFYSLALSGMLKKFSSCLNQLKLNLTLIQVMMGMLLSMLNNSWRVVILNKTFLVMNVIQMACPQDNTLGEIVKQTGSKPSLNLDQEQ